MYSKIASARSSVRHSVGTPSAAYASARTGSLTFAMTWRAPSAGSYTFDTSGTAYDTLLELRDGSCDGAPLACNDDVGTGMLWSSASVTLVVGQHVIVVIDAYRTDRSGTWILNIASP